MSADLSPRRWPLPLEPASSVRDRVEEGVHPARHYSTIALVAGVEFQFDPMRHERAIIARLDLHVLNRRDDAGKCGRHSVEQIDTGIVQGIPSGLACLRKNRISPLQIMTGRCAGGSLCVNPASRKIDGNSFGNSSGFAMYMICEALSFFAY
jgi:hypothetical protein